MNTQKLIQESLEEMNEDSIRQFKHQAKSYISLLAQKQRELAALLESIANLKVQLRELTLSQIDPASLN